MKIGTDGVLLGAWADVEGDVRILDVGTGTGLVALMLAQRNHDAQIVGFDISGDAAMEARDNFAQSPWAERLEACEGDVCSFSSDIKFDHIVSNPPYFVDSLHSPNLQRTRARHTSSLSFDDLVLAAQRLLRPVRQRQARRRVPGRVRRAERPFSKGGLRRARCDYPRRAGPWLRP